MNQEMKQFHIGKVILKNPFILAPMAGITDSSFRQLCAERGAGLTYSEMISAKGLYYNDKATEKLLKITEAEKPVAYQIFGSEPEFMAFAVEKLKDRENTIIDINMGCPVPKVVKNGDGSALLKDLKKAEAVIKATVQASKKPVSVKIRIGWDAKSINTVETAQMIEEAGGSAVAIHGRTRDQYYAGKANWEEIRKVKESVKIPVIGNGDVYEASDGFRLMEETGCDLIMVGRGCLGNPWIFQDLNGRQNTKNQDLFQTMQRHLEMLEQEKGEYAAVREMRKHIGWYLKGIRGAAQLRREVNLLNQSLEVKDLLRQVGNALTMNL